MTLSPILLQARAQTLLWWEQRRTCETCQHFLGGNSEWGGWKCLAVDRKFLYCIDMRASDGACGPEAALYHPDPVREVP